MAAVQRKPQGIWRSIFRLPIWLYRLHLGWLLDSRFLLLTHVGRKSGQPHQTVVEVMRHDKATDTYFVAAGFGRNSDWYRNIRQTPDVVIAVGRRVTPAHVELLSPTAGAQELRAYAHKHPIAFPLLTRFLLGHTPDLTSANLEQVGASMPVVAFHCK